MKGYLLEFMGRRVAYGIPQGRERRERRQSLEKAWEWGRNRMTEARPGRPGSEGQKGELEVSVAAGGEGVEVSKLKAMDTVL